MNERTEEEVTVKTAKSRERPLSLSVSVLPCCSERALFFWPPLISKLEKIAQKGRGEKEATLQSWSEKGNPDSASGFASQLATAQVKKERKEEEDVDIGQTRGRRAKVQFDDFFADAPPSDDGGPFHFNRGGPSFPSRTLQKSIC